MGYSRYWLSGVNTATVKRVAVRADMLYDYLTDSRDHQVVRLLPRYPIVTSLWLYRPAPRKWIGWTAMILFPIGIPVWVLGNLAMRRLRKEMQLIISLDESLTDLIEHKDNHTDNISD